jgi:hypothetical protein
MPARLSSFACESDFRFIIPHDRYDSPIESSVSGEPGYTLILSKCLLIQIGEPSPRRQNS